MTLPVPVVGHPSELTFGATTSSSSPSRARTRPASSTRSPTSRRRRRRSSACRTASPTRWPFLRRFANVHGVTVMAPTWHLEPGVVQAYTPERRRRSSTSAGGRHGVDDVTEAVAAAFRSSPGSSRSPAPTSPAGSTPSCCSTSATRSTRCARATTTPPRSRAGPAPRARTCSPPPASTTSARPTTGPAAATCCASCRSTNGRRPGGSTWQSLARGSTVEVDYLNGEIVLLGRLHGVADAGQRAAPARHPPRRRRADRTAARSRRPTSSPSSGESIRVFRARTYPHQTLG